MTNIQNVGGSRSVLLESREKGRVVSFRSDVVVTT